LLDAKFQFHAEDIRDYFPDDPSDPFRTLIAVTEQGGLIPGLTFRGLGNAMQGNAAIGDNATNTYEATASATYVTGSHAFKVGFSNFWGTQLYTSRDIASGATYRFNTRAPT